MEKKVKNIESTEELKAVIDKVADFTLEYASKHSISEPMSFEDISHIISKDDYLKYFPLVANELEKHRSGNRLKQRIHKAESKAKEYNQKSKPVIHTDKERG